MIRFLQKRLNQFEMFSTGPILWTLFIIVLNPPSVGSAENRLLESDLTSTQSTDPDEELLLEQSRPFLEQGNIEQALASLENFLLRYPNSTLLPDVYLQIAAANRQQGELKRTVEALKAFLQNFPEEARLNDVRLQLSETYLALGDLNEVMAFWAEVPGNEEKKIEVYRKIAEAYTKQQDYLNALRVFVQIKELVLDPETNDAVRNEAVFIVRDKLQEDELQAIIKEYSKRFPADEAMLRLAELYDDKGDYYREERELKRYLSLFQNHFPSVMVKNKIDQIKDNIKSNRYLIAVALHLSGDLAVFRENALNGAQLALEEFKESLPGASVGLAVKDLGENSSSLEASLAAWLDEYRPVAMVGPLMSKVVERVTPIIEKAGLPLITPGATVSHLSGLGNGVFRNAITTRFQCHAITEYAVVTLGLKRFAVLFPNESYGIKWAKCISKEVLKLGGEIVHAEPYSINATDFSPAIRRLKETDLKKGGITEIQDQRRKNREISYSPGFQGIFLPGDAEKVGLLIPQLVFHNINETVLLGTSGWNTPQFVRLVGSYAEGATFIDGFFQESPDPTVQNFVGRYRTRFQQEPDLFSAQAYDATRLILTALEGGAETPQEIKEVITKVKNFPGASGLIYGVKNGEMIKKPFFVQVHKRKFVQIDGPFRTNSSASLPLSSSEADGENTRN